MGLLSPRIEEAENYVRRSFSQWTVGMTRTWNSESFDSDPIELSHYIICVRIQNG